MIPLQFLTAIAIALFLIILLVILYLPRIQFLITTISYKLCPPAHLSHSQSATPVILSCKDRAIVTFVPVDQPPGYDCREA